MDAHPVTPYRVETVRPTDMEGDTGRELTCERSGAADCSEHPDAAGAFAEAVIRSVELIAQPAAKNPVGEMGVRGGLPTGDTLNLAPPLQDTLRGRLYH